MALKGSVINIPSTCVDPHYRYTMPGIMTKVEGKGKMIKTCIVNIGDVAGAIQRPPQYIVQWFGNELGAQSKYTHEEGNVEVATVSGARDASTLQSLLDGFIERYVCCPGCHLPEMDLVVTKGLVGGKCRACTWVGGLDNSTKLAGFIVKKRLDAAGHNVGFAGDGTSGGMDRKARREERARRQREMAAAERVGDDPLKLSPEDIILSRPADGQKKDKARSASPKPKQRKAHKENKKDNKDRNATTERRDCRKSGELAKEESNAGTTGNVRGDPECDDGDESAIRATISSVKAFIMLKGGIPNAEEFFEEVKNQQLARELCHRTRLYIVLEAICGNSLDAALLRDHWENIRLFIEDAGLKADDVLWAFGSYLHANPEVAVALKYSPILKLLYDEDWIDEAGVLEYYAPGRVVCEPGFNEARRAAAPFLKWLEEADSETGDECC